MYDLAAVQAYTRLDMDTIISAIKGRRLDAQRIGRQWYVTMKAIRTWMALSAWRAQGIWGAAGMKWAKIYERYLIRIRRVRLLNEAGRARVCKDLGQSDNSS